MRISHGFSENNLVLPKRYRTALKMEQQVDRPVETNRLGSRAQFVQPAAELLAVKAIAGWGFAANA